MTIKIGHQAKASTFAEIAADETELSQRLRTELKIFIESGRAGKPETNIFRLADGIESGIDAFIAADRLPHEQSLIRQRIGDDFLPIAYAESGNYFCVATSGSDAGSIYFIDYEIPETEAFIELASSYKSFLDVLKPPDPKSVQLNRAK